MSLLYIPVQGVVANVGRCSLHPLDENFAFADIDVVAGDVLRWNRGFPEKWRSSLSPEWIGIVQGFSMHPPEFIQTPESRPTLLFFRSVVDIPLSTLCVVVKTIGFWLFAVVHRRRDKSLPAEMKRLSESNFSESYEQISNLSPGISEWMQEERKNLLFSWWKICGGGVS